MFKSARTKAIMRKMVGGMTPKEVLHLVKDRDLRNSDVPEFVERLLREEGTILMSRLRHYEARILDKYGFLGSVIEKLAIYNRIWMNWDGLEPFPWREERTIDAYLDNLQQ